jgi:serine/threonine-protein kinase
VLTQTLPQARATLDKAGLHLRRGNDLFSETVARGLVLSQSPGPQGRVTKGGTVTVHLSKGPDRRQVPSVTGDDVTTATAALRAVGLVVSDSPSYTWSQTVAQGLVVGTDPGPGTPLRPGTAVQLVLSKGKQPVPVPNVTGMKQDAAAKQLQDLGFVVDAQQVFSDTVPVGVVVDQTPSSGTADKGSTVTLHVSKGPDVVVVPDVRGDSESQARAILTGLGLAVQDRTLPGGPGTVLQTDPKPGRKVKRGSTVTLYVF